ncbi:aminotransferase class V-fold PLP-dependent enzyme [Chryseobacterium sp.]|jgi:selenocysteine lyase/cysteine desulfurase|uniref:aminotransferase class V-fold PLP-dependent enzyme n=1 Tax=Chryseobacterium sp. TaxID=1871047 RepID=UPI00284746B9|nr:aminotransferase class V-fold PLP-dependent enzyme [Chryseobacterium sp.]MDR3022775.1 aminotransferase class V-fold PLP-dependent enzyme [Chryseobacterium sp.]
MNLEVIRQDTLGCSDKIFLNSAGSSLMPKTVVDATVKFLYEEQELGGYAAAVQNAGLINQFYEETAALINTRPSNIAFISSSTDGYAKALSSISFKKGDSIITTNDDYISNQIAFISLQKRYDIEIIRVANLPDHELDLEDFERLIKKHTPKLIAVTHIPTNSGLIQNVEEVGKLCKQYDVLYLVDACQSVGQIIVDVEKINCDFLTATGRKFMRGPRGTGFLYVSDKALNQKMYPLFLDSIGAQWSSFDDFQLNDSAKRFELFERPYAALLGFAEALRYANIIGMEKIEQYNSTLADTLRNNLQNNGFRVLDKGNRLSSIITFCQADGRVEKVHKILTENNVFFKEHKKGDALIDFTSKNVDHAIRLSPHYFNTMEEIEKVSQLLENINH